MFRSADATTSTTRLAGCGRRDLNPQGLRHRHLKPACLPIPPRPRVALPGAAGDCMLATMAERRRHHRAPQPRQARIAGHARARRRACCSSARRSSRIATVGGWEKIQGAKPVQVAYILIYLVLAFYIARWRSGLLPVAASFAIILLIFCAISGPQWFSRDKAGFDGPAAGREHRRHPHARARAAAAAAHRRRRARLLAEVERRGRARAGRRAAVRRPAALTVQSAAPRPGAGTGIQDRLKTDCP